MNLAKAVELPRWKHQAQVVIRNTLHRARPRLVYPISFNESSDGSRPADEIGHPHPHLHHQTITLVDIEALKIAPTIGNGERRNDGRAHQQRRNRKNNPDTF